MERLLRQSGLASPPDEAESSSKSQYESEIEWLLVSKATVQIYGLILQTLLDQIIPLKDDIWYWDGVLGSYAYSQLYMLQTSPVRWWIWACDIYHESIHRMRRLSLWGPEGEQGYSASFRSGLSERWSQFYGIVRDSVRERSISNIQRKILTPVALCQTEARRHQNQLKKLREMTASSLGILFDEGFNFEAGENAKGGENGDGWSEWKGIVERNVALMDMVLKEMRSLDGTISEFEDNVFTGVEEDPELSIHIEDTDVKRKPAVLARRLLELLRVQLPAHVAGTKAIVKEHGRPSRLVRYWIPAGIALLSGGTAYRVLMHRKEDVILWIRDFGVTVQDFFLNWVVEPVQRIISTIRRDKNSEIALMSKDSLKADRDSLERMVVEFSRDRPRLAVGNATVTEAQLEEIRLRVQEGDVTPVLKAYERDLRTPLRGAVAGDLVRTLLIQVQKSKVDLEVAISGIDALLRSQELLFGFLGLTPGVLVSAALMRYLSDVVVQGRRRNRRSARGTTRTLRNIQRILAEAKPAQNNLLSYKDHGLLLCEVHVLRQVARRIPPGTKGDFLEDLDDLANIKSINSQAKALERIIMAYAEWLR